MARSSRWFVVCALLAAVPQAGTPVPLFVQDFDGEDWDDLNDSTLVHDPGVGNPKHRDWPHVVFNHICGGGGWDLAGLATLGASGSSTSLNVHFPQGSFRGKAISYYIGGQERVTPDLYAYFSGGSGDCALVRDSYVQPDRGEAYLRYYVMFPTAFNAGKGHTGKIPGLAGTWRAGAGGYWPHWPDSLGWSARMGWGRHPTDAGDSDSTQLRLFSYVYHLNQYKHGLYPPGTSTGDCIPQDAYGNAQYDSMTVLEKGQWYEIKQRVKMNTEGYADGITEVWVNDVKQPRLCRYDLKYTLDEGAVGINRVWADIYYGGKVPSPAANELYLDGFRLTAESGASPDTIPGDWCLDFNPNDYVSADSMNLSGNALTMSAYLYPHAWPSSSQSYIASIAGSYVSNNDAAMLRLGTGYSGNKQKLQFLLSIGGTLEYVVSDTVNLALDTWYHVAGTYGDGYMKLYVNGQLKASQAQTGNFAATGPFEMARNSGTGGRYLDGRLDDVGVWKRCLTQADIDSVRNWCPGWTTTSLVGYWSFNEGTGDTTKNAAGVTSNTGTLVGPDWLASSSLPGGGRAKLLPALPTVAVAPQSGMDPAYPNPANPETTIRFALRASERVSLAVYNLVGQRVRTLMDGVPVDSGSHAVVWDGTDRLGRPMASGVYVVRLQAGNQTHHQKITLLR